MTRPATSGRILVTGKLLLTDAGSAAVATGAVLVEDGRVLAAGPRGTIERLAKGAARVDVGPHTIMPGMMNLHAHLDSECGADFMTAILLLDEQTATLLSAASARRTLMAGVTTVRDLGNKFATAIAVRDGIARGWLIGPRIMAAGKLVCMTGGHGWFLGHESDGPNEMRKAVRLNLRRGADCIKVIATGGVLSPGVEVGSSQLDPDELATAVAEAHKAGRRVAAHAIGNAGIKNALRAGVDTIEHGCFLDDEAVKLFKKTAAVYVPTLCAAHFLYANLDKLPAYAARKTSEVYHAHRESFRLALKRGIPIASGTDAGTPFNDHASYAVELELMASLGMKPEHALHSATSGAAQALGIASEVGTLTEGKWADLIAVDGDPRKDITACQRVRGVMTRGCWFAV